MCALSSVARLSVSMTMSMSSGLFSMVEDDSDKDKDESKDAHHVGNKEPAHPHHHPLQHPADGGSSSSLQSGGRRHSAPKILTPGATNMSDIEEESLSQHSQQSNKRSIGDGDITTPTSSSGRSFTSGGGKSATNKKGAHRGKKGSPKNTSGVRIVIDRGSESDEDSVDNCSARDTLLYAQDELEDDSRQRRISQFSEVQLLP